VSFEGAGRVSGTQERFRRYGRGGKTNCEKEGEREEAYREGRGGLRKKGDSCGFLKNLRAGGKEKSALLILRKIS